MPEGVSYRFHLAISLSLGASLSPCCFLNLQRTFRLTISVRTPQTYGDIRTYSKSFFCGNCRKRLKFWALDIRMLMYLRVRSTQNILLNVYRPCRGSDPANAEYIRVIETEKNLKKNSKMHSPSPKKCSVRGCLYGIAIDEH